jgi:hypothetical protein
VTAVVRERGIWSCRFRIETFEGEWAPGAEPIAVVECGNLLMHGGVSVLWQCLIGNGSTTAGGALTYFNNANAAIGAGNGTALEAATQTDLQGASRLRKGMDATYPTHTDGTAAGNRTITFRSTFGTADANFDWQEISVHNSVTDGAGRMLNRKVQVIGVKSDTVSRVITATVSID